MDNSILANRLTELREAKGITTNKLAYDAGISQSFLRAVELGQKGISVANLALVCDGLGVSLKRFFDIPDHTDTAETLLLRKVSQLNQAQQNALSAFLDTML